MMLPCISLNCNSQVNGDSLMHTSSHSHTCTHTSPRRTRASSALPTSQCVHTCTHLCIIHTLLLAHFPPPLPLTLSLTHAQHSRAVYLPSHITDMLIQTCEYEYIHPHTRVDNGWTYWWRGRREILVCLSCARLCGALAHSCTCLFMRIHI